MLGAVSGSGTATAASLGQVAIPELRRHGYSAPLSGAIAAAGGSLSGIIPPSIILILYGVATETPVGKLFIGAFIPGILTMIVFILVMLVIFNMESKKSNAVERQKDNAILIDDEKYKEKSVVETAVTMEEDTTGESFRVTTCYRKYYWSCNHGGHFRGNLLGNIYSN